MKTGNCPYCGSSSCSLGMSDFFDKKPKKQKEILNPLKHLMERDDFKEHEKRMEEKRKSGGKH